MSVLDGLLVEGMTEGMVEAVKLFGSPFHKGDNEHLLVMMQAIREQIADPALGHGSFVTAMAEQDYGTAFINADRTNRTFFGALMYYREIIIPNNPGECVLSRE